MTYNNSTTKSFLKAMVLATALSTFCMASAHQTTSHSTTLTSAAAAPAGPVNHCEVGHCMDCNSLNKCTLCKSKLLTSRGECAGKDSISNCLSSSSTECVSCKPGHLAQLNASGSITACASSGITIEHCYNAEQKTGGKQVCVDCKTGYYLDGTTGTCQKVKTEIDHCFTYKSANSCKICKFGHVTTIHETSTLSVDCSKKLAKEGDFAYCNTIKGGKCVACDNHEDRFAVGYDDKIGIKCGKGGKPATKSSMRALIGTGMAALAFVVMAI